MSDASPALASAAGSVDHAAVLRILAGIVLAMFLGALDQTIVATALPTIGRDLGDFDNLPWVVTAYLISSTAVTPLYGKLSDIHGRRTMLLASLALFVLGSVACAVAPDHAGTDRRPWAPGRRWRRVDLARPDHHRRCRGPEGTRALPGPDRVGVRGVERDRSGAGRRVRGEAALVVDLLDQPAVGAGGATADRSRAACAAAPRSAPSDST